MPNLKHYLCILLAYTVAQQASVLFAVSLPVNLVALLKERRDWASWGKALTWTALTIWLVHTLFSMVTTYAAWGVFIAWFEPRTRFTFTLAVVGMIITVAAHVVDSSRFSALAFVAGRIDAGIGPAAGCCATSDQPDWPVIVQ